MKCPNCHKEVEKGSLYCPHCLSEIPWVREFDSVETQLRKKEQRLIRRSRAFPTFFLIRKPLKT